MGRTYSRADYLRSQVEWSSFDYRWSSIRQLASERGILFPPSGSRHDDRDAEEPSQRAIIWRALQDNPTELRRIVGRCYSWNGVVAGIIGLETRLRLDADDRDRDDDFDRAAHPTHRQAVMTLGSIFDRIDQSRGTSPEATSGAAGTGSAMKEEVT